MSTDKTEQARLDTLRRDLRLLSANGRTSSLRALAIDALNWIEERAALAQRQQGGVGQAERALSDLLKAHAMHASCQAGLLDRCLCVRCASERARAAITAAPPAQPQSEMAMELLRTDFKRECDDTDMILRMLGLEPENCRTDGGSLKTTWILDALEARDRLIRRTALAAQPPERAAQQDAQEPNV